MLSEALKTSLADAFANFDSLPALRSLELVGDALRARSTIPARATRMAHVSTLMITARAAVAR